ncbi:MAG: 50S ribosomal protein L25 [Chloroflexi bacterium]|nr:50S ribosomal protein L25 [Chloroflexota bacterium]
MDVQILKVSQRTVVGKKVKALRRQGIVPVHVYGSGIDPLALQVDTQALSRILPRVGTNVPLSIEIEEQDGENICFVREVQRHPVTENVIHVDFFRVDVSQTTQAEVPITIVGVAPAVRDLNGTLMQPLQSVLVEALPMNIPVSIEVDISGLDNFDKALHVSDVTVDSRVTIVTNAEEMVARISAPRIEVEAGAGVAEDGVTAGAAAAEEESEG